MVSYALRSLLSLRAHVSMGTLEHRVGWFWGILITSLTCLKLVCLSRHIRYPGRSPLSPLEVGVSGSRLRFAFTFRSLIYLPGSALCHWAFNFALTHSVEATALPLYSKGLGGLLVGSQIAFTFRSLLPFLLGSSLCHWALRFALTHVLRGFWSPSLFPFGRGNRSFFS